MAHGTTREDTLKELENLSSKVIAVTGARGYIGSALVDSLARYRPKILRVSRQKLAPIEGMASMMADIRAFDCWLDIVAQADVIFHLAGGTSVYAAAKNPAENLYSTLLPINHLVRAAQELGRRPRVIFASTATVYGLTSQLPVGEEAELKPVTVYDLHKLFGEQQLALATKQGILEGVSLRLANIYGPSSSTSSADDRGILNRVTAMALQGRDLKIFGDGEYLRDYVYIQDVINAFLLAGVAAGMGGEVFNIGSGVATSLRKAFELVVTHTEKETGRRINCDSVPWPSGADPIEFRNFVAKNEKIAAATGWQAVVGLEDGIRFLISDYKKNGAII